MSESTAQFPHCDELILHEPGTCAYCDHYPKAQAQRLVDGVNFTGQSDLKKKPCPATLRRPFAKLNRWGGNRANGSTFVLPEEGPNGQ